jgi:hypothetical protein
LLLAVPMKRLGACPTMPIDQDHPNPAIPASS